VFQGLFEPLRRIRVFMPWTYWGGPFGIDGDPQRSIVFSGSPHWWVVYLSRCAHRVRWWRSGTIRAGVTVVATSRSASLVAVAVTTCMLAMWTGTADTLINPLPGSVRAGVADSDANHESRARLRQNSDLLGRCSGSRRR
jgi:hypothetical protein